MSDTYEIDNAVCVAESKNGKSILVEADIFDEPQWIAKAVIHDNSEVYERDTNGTLIVQSWFARNRG